MKQGAADYISKPFDHDELLMLVQRLLRQSALARQAAALKSDLSQAYPVNGMVGDAPAMREVFERIAKVAPTDATVLIPGESGTGKELVARALHEHSQRRDGPIVTVNYAAIPEGLIESELSGHEKGAFTGATETCQGLVEDADGGTLFLDEIGELPPAAQARLLRVLQEGEIRRVGADRPPHVNVRLLAATHRNLQQRVEEGLFRSDLYFRLRVMEIQLPPLRERGEDIPRLADFLLEKACRRLNKPPLGFSRATIADYPWPGNVRELGNTIERAIILSEYGTITPELLAIDADHTDRHNGSGAERATAEKLSLDEYFIRFVREHEARMTETELSQHLGISRKTLWERRQRLGIPRRRETT
jgi:DNA-binding NtrC family response regulator